MLFFKGRGDAVCVDVECGVLEHVCKDIPELWWDLESCECLEQGAGGDAVKGLGPVKEDKGETVGTMFALVQNSAQKVECVTCAAAGSEAVLCVSKVGGLVLFLIARGECC